MILGGHQLLGLPREALLCDAQQLVELGAALVVVQANLTAGIIVAF